MRAIKRSAKHEDVVRRLTDENHPVSKKPLFPTIRELMCFAAVLGFENELHRDLEDKINTIEPRPFEGHQQTIDLFYLIALAHKQDAKVLHEDNEEEIISIFERYANGGFEVLTGWLNEKPDDLYGDKAILAALAKYGFFPDSKTSPNIIVETEF